MKYDRCRVVFYYRKLIAQTHGRLSELHKDQKAKRDCGQLYNEDK